ncbi:MAG: FAD binding domain-containing protein [Vicinamibacterales bacterium]
MKAFVNVNASSLDGAVDALVKARAAGRLAVIAGGGSDLLGLMKERLIQPDVVVNLKTIPSLNQVSVQEGATRIGGLITLDALARDPIVREQYGVLADAASKVGTPQIRNTGTLAGNVCQRPWCWYMRNGFPCYKNGGDRCFARNGENQHHAIFGQGPSYIVHPSDTAPALVALDASFRLVGPGGERHVKAADFFVMPTRRPRHENVLGDDEILAEVVIPSSPAGRRSTYEKVMDRESWTHAVVSVAVVLDMAGDLCRHASIVLGGVAPVPLLRRDAAALLEGTRITDEVIARVAAAVVADARPLSKNAYKVPLTRGIVRKTIAAIARG